MLCIVVLGHQLGPVYDEENEVWTVQGDMKYRLKETLEYMENMQGGKLQSDREGEMKLGQYAEVKIILSGGVKRIKWPESRK